MEDFHIFLFEGFPKGASVQCNGEVEAVVRAGCGDGNVEGGGEEPHHLHHGTRGREGEAG